MSGTGRKEKLLRTRAQVELVRRLGEKLRAMEPGVRAVEMTGMPRGGGLPCGLDAALAKKDALERLLTQECARLRRYEEEARREMDTMRPEIYAFAAMYYLCAMSVEETAEALGRSERQCMRYKQTAEQEPTTMEKRGRAAQKCAAVLKYRRSITKGS